MRSVRYDLWGSELSPFSLKARAMLDHAAVEYRWLPAQGHSLENSLSARRVRRLRRGRLPLTYPVKSPLDEFPLVPFLLGDDGSNVYDSTAMAEWLDARPLAIATRRLVPDDPVVAMAARLIDEYFDEFGLYMAHHNRWVTSARTNDAGVRLAREFSSLIPPGCARILAERFSARQVRRLPYLFSVATDGFSLEGLPRRRQPPSRAGFPPTHELLDVSFVRMLERVELVLAYQPFLLGDRFTIADASAYGQLAMNTHDPDACGLIERYAPQTFAWVQRVERGNVRSRMGQESAAVQAGLVVSPRLRHLLEEISRTFVPLMQQNEAAYEHHLARGCTRFNEAAFDRNEALYDGHIVGHRFRSVAKTFQVAVWRKLRAQWGTLGLSERAALPISLD